MAQIIVGKFASYLLIDGGATLSIRRVEYDIESEIKAPLQAWQQNLNNGQVTLNGVTATGSESVTSGQTLVWNRPPWIEPDSP